MELTDVGLFSHLMAAVGFGVLAVATAFSARRGQASLWLSLAALMTMAWAMIFVLVVRNPDVFGLWLSPAETLRSAAWIGFLVAMLRPTWQLDERLRSSFVIAGAIGFIATLQLALDLFGASAGVLSSDRSIVGQLFIVMRLTVAVSGLVLVHNFYQNSGTTGRGGVRLIAIGLAGLFGYDLNFYTLAFLLPPPSTDLFNIRGAVDSIIVPLLLLSARETWVARVQVSRQVVFHTLSFSMIGFYLIAMALLAYGLRLVGGDWGRLFQISFLFATATIGAVVMVSPRFRAALRVQIAQNFFAYRYDYRLEWLRFIATVSRTGSEETAGALHERVIQAVCTVLDSPGGVLLIPEDDMLVPTAGWNVRNFTVPPVSRHSGLGAFLFERQRVINFDELRDGEGDYSGVELPAWAAGDSRFWLCVPLVHLDGLAGAIILERTVASRVLNWEDYDLLRTLGRQAASYIAESSTQMALDDAAKFDEFNRRFAFIMHDIKNLVSQLSLVARNAERHADNPAFRADMVVTLQSSVGKMNDLLARLSQRPGGRGDAERTEIDLPALLAQVVDAKRLAHPALQLRGATGQPVRPVLGDAGQIEQLFLHLVQNAIDASEEGAPVVISIAQTGGEAVVRIEDQGKGMSPRFIRQELFQPFRSTKPGGFGIGAYEAREIARNHGGRLDVVSEEGEGSCFTIALPLAVAAWQEAAQ